MRTPTLICVAVAAAVLSGCASTSAGGGGSTGMPSPSGGMPGGMPGGTSGGMPGGMPGGSSGEPGGSSGGLPSPPSLPGDSPSTPSSKPSLPSDSSSSGSSGDGDSKSSKDSDKSGSATPEGTAGGAQTSEEKRQAGEKGLDDSLGDFDKTLKKEQERVAKERDARGSAEGEGAGETGSSGGEGGGDYGKRIALRGSRRLRGRAGRQTEAPAQSAGAKDRSQARRRGERIARSISGACQCRRGGVGTRRRGGEV